jgi:hypothetical protein
MAIERPHRESTSVDGRQRSSRDDEAALRLASLSSPAFEESWQAGSPLDWTEFIARWQSPNVHGGPVGAVAVRSRRDPEK